MCKDKFIFSIFGGAFLLAGIFIATSPARGGVLLADDFSDGQINGVDNTAGPSWTITTGGFTVLDVTGVGSTDGKELQGDPANSIMKAANTAAPQRYVTADLHFRSRVGGGKILYFYLIDDSTGDGFGFKSLISRSADQIQLQLVKTSDGGQTPDVLNTFGTIDPYGGSADFQDFEYRWDRDTGTFTALLNGASIGAPYVYTGADLATLSDFDTTAITMNNTDARLDGFSVTTAVPEPGLAAWLGLLAPALLCRRRQRI